MRAHVALPLIESEVGEDLAQQSQARSRDPLKNRRHQRVSGLGGQRGLDLGRGRMLEGRLEDRA
ncbi:hypothetical protein [Streptosporangium sp. NPDC000396]|uniref:hypothetical protein n=1 Tax=Streptosporangium sp. NPDC000396 TaxID=3366185 RepID=UPI0036A9FBBD